MHHHTYLNWSFCLFGVLSLVFLSVLEIELWELMLPR